jgi:hypothetical protein
MTVEYDEQRSEKSGREARVPRMLRSAISAFTRVFDALCLLGAVRC